VKVMVTVTVFESDPAAGEQRTLTIGDAPEKLPLMVAERLHDLVAWLLKDKMPDGIPDSLWGDLTDAA
jgi:hypothetical protein